MATITATVSSVGPHASVFGGTHTMELKAVTYKGRLYFLSDSKVYVNGKGSERCRLFVLPAAKAAMVRANCAEVAP